MLKLGQIIDGETRDRVNNEIAELKTSVQTWIRIAGENQKSANLCAAEIAKKDEEIILLSTERDEALKLKRWADNDVLEIRRLLDLLGAPTKQPSGYPYSIVGMLSALTAQIVGESWAATIRELHARISQQRVEIARLKQLGEKSGEEIRHLRACIVDQADWGLCKEEWMAEIAKKDAEIIRLNALLEEGREMCKRFENKEGINPKDMWQFIKKIGLEYGGNNS